MRPEILSLEQERKVCLATEYYARAADLQSQIQTVSQECQQGRECVDTAEQERGLQTKLKECVDDGKYAEAAQLQRQIQELVPQEAPTTRGGPGTGSAASTAVDIVDLFRSDVAFPSLITLQHVRVLSVAPVSTSNVKGKGKGKGKSKSKTQSSLSGKSKVKETGESCAMYVGAKGYVVCILAYNATVTSLRQVGPGCTVEIRGLKVKHGIVGTLDATPGLHVTKDLVASLADPRNAFQYTVDEVTDQFATMEHAQLANVNTYVDLPLHCTLVEQKEKMDGESYLSFYGRDMNGVLVGPLRLWRFNETDAHVNNIYIIRGLKVILDTYWCNNSWEWKPCTDGSKRLECNFRTALEDVTTIESIASMFE